MLSSVCLLLNRISESVLSKLRITSKVGADCNAIHKNSFRTAVEMTPRPQPLNIARMFLSLLQDYPWLRSLLRDGCKIQNLTTEWKTFHGSGQWAVREKRKNHVHGQVVKPNTLFTNKATIFCLERWEIRFGGGGPKSTNQLYSTLKTNCARMTSSRYASSLTVQEVHGRNHLRFFSISASSQSLPEAGYNWNPIENIRYVCGTAEILSTNVRTTEIP